MVTDSEIGWEGSPVNPREDSTGTCSVGSTADYNVLTKTKNKNNNIGDDTDHPRIFKLAESLRASCAASFSLRLRSDKVSVLRTSVKLLFRTP